MIHKRQLMVFLTTLLICAALPILTIGLPAQENPEQKTDLPVQLKADSTQLGERIIVVTYFHTNKRCKSCKLIESMSHDILTKDFKDQLADGRIEWRTVNVSKSENKHFVDKYELYAQSVVISELIGGREVRWSNLDQVWQLLRKPDEFYTYIRTEVQTFLDGK